MVEFTVIGDPKALKRHRHSRFGTYDPSKKDKKAFYIKSLKHKPIQPLSGNLFLDLKFYFNRPKSHYRTGKYKDLLKPSAPRYYHSQKPDIDNLIKLVADSIQGQDRFIIDDAMVCSVRASKMWIGEGEKPRTEVNIFGLYKGKD